MSDENATEEKRNLPIMTGQSTFAQAAWTMASPSIVLTFLAVSLELPVFLIGALVSIRQFGGTLADIFLFDPVSRIQKRKHTLALTGLLIAACFVLAILASLFGNKSVIVVVFVLVIFIVGLVSEVQNLILTDFISDNLRSKSRIRMQYAQMAFGGAIAIALTWIAHRLTLDIPPLHRHSIVVAIAITCFLIAAISVLAVRDIGAATPPETEPVHSPVKAAVVYYHNVRRLLSQSWFRNVLALRLLFAIVTLSVPFFALIAAETHHQSDQGLAALIISSAGGAIVAGPLWRTLNGFSHRTVMVTSTALVALTGIGLVVAHFLHLDQSVHVHAAALFIVTVAVTGLTTVNGLYFMDVAPKDQRVMGIAVAKSFGRATLIIVSACLAAIAHMHETVWAIMLIVFISAFAALLSGALAVSRTEPAQATP